MRLPDWPKWKIMLVMWGAALPVMIAVVVAGYANRPSADCERADTAAHRIVGVIHATSMGMAGHPVPDLPREVTESEAAIRAEAAAIEDDELRTEVLALADAVQRIGRGNVSAPPHGFPDRDVVGGRQDLTNALQAMRRTCPNVGTDEPPPT